jgi:glycerophosphoryl diester phosphodiesterase
MKKSFFAIISLLLFSCAKDSIVEEKPIPTQPTIYKVVSHRGGYKESGAPECSIQGLYYSKTLGCYAAECDIIITKDRRVLVCHPDDRGLVNGFVPYEKNLAEIRAAGKLKNNEDIPVIEDFLDFLCDSEKNPYGMKIWIDTKALSNLSYTIDAINVAYEAIKDRNAYDLCEFIIPQNNTLFNMVKQTAMFKEKKCNVAFMASDPAALLAPSSIEENMWHAMRYNAIFSSSAKYTLTDYFTNDVQVSIWCTSTMSTEDTELLQKALPYYQDDHLKAIFVNYPNAAIKKIKAEGLNQ